MIFHSYVKLPDGTLKDTAHTPVNSGASGHDLWCTSMHRSQHQGADILLGRRSLSLRISSRMISKPSWPQLWDGTVDGRNPNHQLIGGLSMFIPLFIGFQGVYPIQGGAGFLPSTVGTQMIPNDPQHVQLVEALVVKLVVKLPGISGILPAQTESDMCLFLFYYNIYIYIYHLVI